MKAYSEKTRKFYNTVEECEKAEKEYDDQRALVEAKRKELADARSTRAKEVEDAFKAVIEADKKYHELLKKFMKDYGNFHATYQDDNIPVSLFDLFFGLF